MVKNKLFIPTLIGFRNMLRPVVESVDNNGALATLFNPCSPSDFELKGRELFQSNRALDELAMLELIANPNVNVAIDDNLIIYGVYSYLYFQKDIRNQPECTTSIKELSQFLGISLGNKGIDLVQKLLGLNTVYGFIYGVGVFPLLEIEMAGKGNLIIRSEYFQIVTNLMIRNAIELYGDGGKYYCNYVHANIVNEKNKVSAMIVIELASLIAEIEKKHTHIQLLNLVSRIPQLLSIWLTPSTTSRKNRNLKHGFDNVHQILETKTDLLQIYEGLEIIIPKTISINKPNNLINIKHQGFKKKGVL